MLPPENITVSATAKIPVLLLPAGEWFISIQKKTCGHILAPSGEPRYGNNTYKIRTTVERSINQFKDSFGLAGRKTQNEKTLHADLLLAGITQLIGVILADKIKQHQYIRSLKPLIA